MITVTIPSLIDPPITASVFDRTLAEVQRTLDLPAVVSMYGGYVGDARDDGSFKLACPLRSTTGFDGTCAEEDASVNSSALPESLKLYDTDVPGVYRWHCYSCKRGGCVVDFIMHAEGWTNNEGRRTSLRALRRASQISGLSFMLDSRPPGPQDQPSRELVIAAVTQRAQREVNHAPVDIERAHALNNAAAHHWMARLRGSVVARNYLYARGVTDEQAQRYGLGYALASWDDLADTIDADDKPLAQRLGLLSMSSRCTLIDAQRDRLIFPYLMPVGDGFAVAGFAGRRRDDTDIHTHKFHNSLNVPGVWVKASALWGLAQALERARETGRLVICEGVFDALAFDRIGAAAVALVSAVLSKSAAAAIREHVGHVRITLALDGDTTGRDAAEFWVESLLGEGWTLDAIDIIDSDDGQDPGSTDKVLLTSRYLNPVDSASFLIARGCMVDTCRIPAHAAALQARIEALAAALDADRTPPYTNFREWLDNRKAKGAELRELQQQLAAAMRAT